MGRYHNRLHTMGRISELEEIVERVDWMSPIDYEILSFFASHNIIINPSSLAANIDYGAGYVADRCLLLTENGLLEQLDGPMYRLTELGERFVAGEADASDLDGADSY